MNVGQRLQCLQRLRTAGVPFAARKQELPVRPGQCNLAQQGQVQPAADVAAVAEADGRLQVAGCRLQVAGCRLQVRDGRRAGRGKGALEGRCVHTVGDELDAAGVEGFELQQTGRGDDGQIGCSQEVALFGQQRGPLAVAQVAEGRVVVGDVVDQQAVTEAVRGPAPVGGAVEPGNGQLSMLNGQLPTGCPSLAIER